MHLAQDNDVVHTLTPDRSDQPFGKAILPERSWCGGLEPARLITAYWFAPADSRLGPGFHGCGRYFRKAALQLGNRPLQIILPLP